jgi:hypothetical protein
MGNYEIIIRVVHGSPGIYFRLKRSLENCSQII